MQALSVSQFIAYLNDTFKAIWDPTQVTVEGEVSEFRVSQGQWVNFNLKDEEACVGVFMVAAKLNVPLEDGVRVRLYGCPRIYPKWGKFSFNAERVELIGEGALRKALAVLRAKLEAEGLFEPTRKRELPRFPTRVALIASRQSAAYGDFIRILNERWSGLEIDSYQAVVQGERAPESVMAALDLAHANGPYDALVITRGGGSLEELMAFNDERLTRAIFASKIPTLVAIGHERDVTLAEEAADVRGSTPTDCARRLVPDKRDVLYEISMLENSALLSLEERINTRREQIEAALRHAEHWLSDVRHRMQVTIDRALEAAPRWQSLLNERLDAMLRLVRSFDPDAVLRRGYALITDPKGRAKVSAGALKAGDSVIIRLHDGEAGAMIDGAQGRLI